jgi:hypothetical protein
MELETLKALWAIHCQCVAWALVAPKAYAAQAEREARWALNNFEWAVEDGIRKANAALTAARQDCERRNGLEP